MNCFMHATKDELKFCLKNFVEYIIKSQQKEQQHCDVFHQRSAELIPLKKSITIILIKRPCRKLPPPTDKHATLLTNTLAKVKQRIFALFRDGNGNWNQYMQY